jgi:hypothetical protein
MNTPDNLGKLRKALFKVAKPVTSRVLQLKNRNKGESCYIFGDGISIKWFDLSAFPEKPAFALGYVPYHLQSESLNLKYGLLTEPKYFYPYFKLPWPPKTWWRNKIQNKYRDLILDQLDMNFFVNLSNYPFLRGENIYYIFRAIDDSNFEFQRECFLKGEGIYNGSLRCAIALAIYMGFEDITLVGCDYTHESSRSLHWYEKGEGVLSPQPDYQQLYLGIAQRYAKITTITLEGRGSVLPAKTYTEFTGCPLIFRENDELMDMQTLKLLATWPGYTIL